MIIRNLPSIGYMRLNCTVVDSPRLDSSTSSCSFILVIISITFLLLILLFMPFYVMGQVPAPYNISHSINGP